MTTTATVLPPSTRGWIICPAWGGGNFEDASRNVVGVIDLSAPVFDLTRGMVAAITTPFIQRLTSASMPFDQAASALVATCRKLSRRLGAGIATQD